MSVHLAFLNGSLIPGCCTSTFQTQISFDQNEIYFPFAQRGFWGGGGAPLSLKISCQIGYSYPDKIFECRIQNEEVMILEVVSKF